MDQTPPQIPPWNEANPPWEPAEDWYAREPAVSHVLVAELQRFKRRMKAHPIPVLLLAVLLTAATLAWFAMKPRFHTARVVLRISEGAISQYEGPVLPHEDLESYIYDYSLPDPVLLDQVVEEQGFFRAELEKFGPDLAIDELREGLSIDIFDNYFFFGKRQEITPRSLRVAINYRYQDPDVAYALARLLADLVIAQESQKRADETRFAAANARAILEQGERDLRALDERLTQAQVELAQALLQEDQVEAAMQRVEVDDLSRRLILEQKRVKGLRQETEQLELDSQLEERHLGLVFETAGEVRPHGDTHANPILLTLVGLACFCIFVPVCAIGLGTFDSRVHEPEDVRRLGLPVVGHIPSFAGEHVGSLEARGVIEPPGMRQRLGLGGRRRVRRPSADRVA